MSYQESYVTTEDGVRLYVQRSGDGQPALVVLNGLFLFDHFQQLAGDRTIIFVDPRSGGRSEAVTDVSRLSQGVHHTVDDVEAIRRHFDLGKIAVLGHSYMGFAAVLYALKYPAHASRVVQIGPMEPRPGVSYPSHLTGADDALHEALVQLGDLMARREFLDPRQFCRLFWSIVLPIYVVNPADTVKLKWDRCDLPNQLNFMANWMGHLLPSIVRLKLSKDTLAGAALPVLIIHGRTDRSAPYGGAREWALMLPNARLVTVEHAGHAPWIENPQLVFDSVATFLDGVWPEASHSVTALDPNDEASALV